MIMTSVALACLRSSGAWRGVREMIMMTTRMVVLIFTRGLKDWEFLGDFEDKGLRARQLTGCLSG